MKVAHVLRKYDPAEWGGTETALRGLCDGLRHHGVASVVFGPRIPVAAADDPLTEAGCVVKRFRACVPILGLASAQRKQMVAMGGNLMSFDLVQKLWREPDLAVVHAHALGRIGAISRMVAHRRGLPFVVTIHGGVYDLPVPVRQGFEAAATRGWEWGKICGLVLRTRQLLAGADAIVTCNECEAALIRERHPGRRVVVQAHGVPAQLYQPDHRAVARAAYPQVQGRSVLLVVGRIGAIKNQSWLVEQMPALLQRHPGLLLVLAGAPTDYDYAEALHRRIALLGLGNDVLVAGGIPPGDPRLIGLLQEARAVVLPSLAEPFGLVILEAWAAGTPVMATRTSGAESLLEHGKTGLLFELARTSEFHAGVDALWGDAALAARLAAAGRARVVADFDTHVLAGRMKRLYEDLIEQRQASRRVA